MIHTHTQVVHVWCLLHIVSVLYTVDTQRVLLFRLFVSTMDRVELFISANTTNSTASNGTFVGGREGQQWVESTAAGEQC